MATSNRNPLTFYTLPNYCAPLLLPESTEIMHHAQLLCTSNATRIQGECHSQCAGWRCKRCPVHHATGCNWGGGGSWLAPEAGSHGQCVIPSLTRLGQTPAVWSQSPQTVDGTRTPPRRWWEGDAAVPVCVLHMPVGRGSLGQDSNLRINRYRICDAPLRYQSCSTTALTKHQKFNQHQKFTCAFPVEPTRNVWLLVHVHTLYTAHFAEQAGPVKSGPRQDLNMHIGRYPACKAPLRYQGYHASALAETSKRKKKETLKERNMKTSTKYNRSAVHFGTGSSFLLEKKAYL